MPQSFKTPFERLFFDVLSLFISAGLSEKNATSEPDIKAEIKRSIIRITIPIIVLKSGVLTIVSGRDLIFARRIPGSN
jgi:hypothetical protein